MTIRLEFDETVSLLKRAIEEKGADFVYEDENGEIGGDCQYFHGDEPGCIVGHILAYKGMTGDTFPLAHNRDNVNGLRGDEVISMDNATYRLLSTVQREQDEGRPWGVAFEVALGYVNENKEV